MPVIHRHLVVTMVERWRSGRFQQSRLFAALFGSERAMLVLRISRSVLA